MYRKKHLKKALKKETLVFHTFLKSGLTCQVCFWKQWFFTQLNSIKTNKKTVLSPMAVHTEQTRQVAAERKELQSLFRPSAIHSERRNRSTTALCVPAKSELKIWRPSSLGITRKMFSPGFKCCWIWSCWSISHTVSYHKCIYILYHLVNYATSLLRMLIHFHPCPISELEVIRQRSLWASCCPWSSPGHLVPLVVTSFSRKDVAQGSPCCWRLQRP